MELCAPATRGTPRHRFCGALTGAPHGAKPESTTSDRLDLERSRRVLAGKRACCVWRGGKSERSSYPYSVAELLSNNVAPAPWVEPK